MDFKKATDVLFEGISHEDLAKALGVSVALIRQARLDSGAQAHRTPPKGWQNAATKIAQARIRRLETLCSRIKDSQ